MVRIALVFSALLLAACDRGPSESDMAGCTVRSSGPPLTYREVADCAVERSKK